MSAPCDRCIVRGRVAKRSTKQPTASTSDAGGAGQREGDPATIDGVLNGLEQVVAQLEGGDLPLEEALARFERGVALARQGGAMLERVEERVEVLLADRNETAPFQPSDDSTQENDQ